MPSDDTAYAANWRTVIVVDLLIGVTALVVGVVLLVTGHVLPASWWPARTASRLQHPGGGGRSARPAEGGGPLGAQEGGQLVELGGDAFGALERQHEAVVFVAGQHVHVEVHHRLEGDLARGLEQVDPVGAQPLRRQAGHLLGGEGDGHHVLGAGVEQVHRMALGHDQGVAPGEREQVEERHRAVVLVHDSTRDPAADDPAEDAIFPRRHHRQRSLPGDAGRIRHGSRPPAAVPARPGHPPNQRPGPGGDLQQPGLAGRPPGRRRLDLFAGTGALGIEALSRGAASVTFIDSDRAAVALVGENLAALGLEGGKVVRADALRFLDGSAAVDVAFVDPPYAFADWPALLARLRAGIAVLESDHPVEVGDAWEVLKVKRYGGTVVTLVRQKGSP